VSAIPLDGVYPCLPPCLLLTATESQIRQIGNHESDQREHALRSHSNQTLAYDADGTYAAAANARATQKTPSAPNGSGV
jgi:hypothetical protein